MLFEIIKASEYRGSIVICLVTLSIEDFLVLRQKLPVADVRSEGEFQQGHIQHAINIPLLNNSERIEVGTLYKQQGQLEAIRKGFELVGPRLLGIIDTASHAARHGEMIVHCWRGGMRSGNFCQFVNMAGIKTHQLKGGYKTYRHLALEAFKNPFQFIVLGGYTGSGKSEVLRALARAGEQVLDLEQLANHKGSVFGGLMKTAQPTTEQFQNDLFEEILKLDLSRRIWIEDEAIAIGKIFLPIDLWNSMKASSLVEIDLSKAMRVKRLVNEYGSANRTEFLTAMTSITKKLGGQHFKAAKEKLLADDMAATIDILLTYYDKAYQNSLIRRQSQSKAVYSWDGQNVNSIIQQLISSK